MKSKVLLVLLAIFMTSTALAAMPPAPNYCEHMGYNYKHVENGSQSEGICQFNENESCEAGSFLEGECGQEHVKEISCREEGEAVFTEFESCCGEMKPHVPPGAIGQPTCQPEKTFVEKFSANFEVLTDLAVSILGLA